MPRQPTKPGRYGTLYLWNITIAPLDPGQPNYDVTRWAYSIEHAWERAIEEIEGDEWGDRVVSIEPVRKGFSRDDVPFATC